MSHVFRHINFNINAFRSRWIIIFTRQVVEINWPIKFNDKRIIKTGYRNPTRSKKRKVSINYNVFWLESNRMVSHFLSFCYFTQYQQFQKQSGNQFLLLNPSFKGWRSWKSWSIVTVLFSPYLLKKRVYKPLIWKRYPEIVFLKFFFFFLICLQSISDINDFGETYLRVLHGKGLYLLGQTAGIHRNLLREPPLQHLRKPKWDIKVSVVTLSPDYQRQIF